MNDLLSLARGYLAAEGWDVKARGRDLLRGDRDGRRGDDEKDFVYVWVPGDAGSSFSSREGPYLRRFQEAKEVHPTAEKVFLVPNLAGLSNEFRNGARRWHGVRILVPAQFFDTNFRWENDDRTASASSELRKRGADTAATRISQPFSEVGTHDVDSDESRADLLETLHGALRRPHRTHDEPTIHVVVGPAGMGKSVLFESLYASLYEEFQSDKRAQHLSARPFALLPEYLDDASASNIRSLLDAYLRTEFARPLDREVFNWRLVHGLGTWLLDGLDEILERDIRFFDYLADLMTMPDGDSPPSIVICVRDSLFATHRGLKDFCEEYTDHVIIYRLEGWQRQAKADFARSRLQSTEMADEFIRILTQLSAIDKLASTPYYCDLLIEEFAAGELSDQYSETQILERGLQRIITRERGKELLRDMPDEGIREFIESCAITNLIEGGVAVEDVREFAEIVIPGGIDEEELTRLVVQMSQIATFAQGSDGRLRFAQEALEHYLAANYLARGLQRSSDSLGDLGRQELPENVLRLIPACIRADTEAAVWNLLAAKMHEDSVAGRNALRLAVCMSAGTDRLSNVQFAGVDLSGLGFDGHNLRGAHFNGADLTNTDFRSANLTGASVDNCLIKGTVLPANQEMLRSIDFGQMRRFYSAYLGEEFVDNVADFVRAVGGDSDGKVGGSFTCAAARQLRHLFGKYVEETGRGRRKELPRRALLRGSHLVSNVDDILEETIRAGYLVEGPFRERIRRAEDDSYGEIVQFRTALELSPGLKALLDETCQEADCPHVA